MPSCRNSASTCCEGVTPKKGSRCVRNASRGRHRQYGTTRGWGKTYAKTTKRRGASKAKVVAAHRMLEIMRRTLAEDASYRIWDRQMAQRERGKMQRLANTS